MLESIQELMELSLDWKSSPWRDRGKSYSSAHPEAIEVSPTVLEAHPGVVEVSPSEGEVQNYLDQKVLNTNFL